MSRLREEGHVISRGVWVLAGVVSLTTSAGLFFLMSRNAPDFANWPSFVRALFLFGLPLILFSYVLFVGYVYRDSKRRGMRPVMWTLLVIFIPNMIGFILYFILRDPILQGCRQCGADVRTGFAYCPKCGTPRAQTCPQCRRPVESDWAHCPQCGSKLQGIG
jgi:hypothetical protein